MLFDLVGADRIELTFPSGAKTQAVVDSYRATPEQATTGSGTELVVLRPEIGLEADMIGNPVEVRILRGAGGRFAWLTAAASSVSTLFGGGKS